MLTSLLLPVLLSGVALFFASFLSWMVLQFHKQDWVKLDKEAGVCRHPPAVCFDKLKNLLGDWQPRDLSLALHLSVSPVTRASLSDDTLPEHEEKGHTRSYPNRANL